MSHFGRQCINGILAALAGAGVIAMATATAAQTTRPAEITVPAEPTTAPAKVVGTDKAKAKEKEGLLKSSRPGFFEEFHMRDADLRIVLEQLSRQNKINIIATKDVTGKIAAIDLYNVDFEQALSAVAASTGFTYFKDGDTYYFCTTRETAARLKDVSKLEVRAFPLSYITAADAKVLVAPVLSPDGKVDVSPVAVAGIATSKTEAGGNTYAGRDTLIVKDYKEYLDRVAAVLKDLDVRPEQVILEATILRVTLTETNALGIDFNALAGVNFSQLSNTTTGLTSLTPGKDVSVDNLNSRNATFRTDFTAGIDPGGMTIGFVSNDISLFIRALEGVTDVTVLANPKLLVVNKQRGEVMVGRRDGYLTTTITETTATQTVEFLETGTRLIMRPFIAKDGYVRLELHPEDSSGQVEQVGTSALPSETTTEVTSNVLVRDGHTIVIGGLFRERTSAGRSQVPGVGNIPYVGMLFRKTVDRTDREEVVILVTPRIIKHAADEITSEQLKDDVMRYRIGARKGLRWWGRDRLAQTYLRWAKEELRKGDRDKAVWDLDMTLSLQPQMIEAVRLKERLTGEAYWANQSQHSTASYIIQRLIMQGLGKPVEMVIPPGKPRDGATLPKDVREAFGIGPRPEVPLPEPAPPAEMPKPQPSAPAAADVKPDATPAKDAAKAKAAAPDDGEGK